MISKIVKSIWKPWNYLSGADDGEGTQTPSEQTGEKEPAEKRTDEASNPSPGKSDFKPFFCQVVQRIIWDLPPGNTLYKNSLNIFPFIIYPFYLLFLKVHFTKQNIWTLFQHKTTNKVLQLCSFAPDCYWEELLHLGSVLWCVSSWRCLILSKYMMSPYHLINICYESIHERCATNFSVYNQLEQAC